MASYRKKNIRFQIKKTKPKKSIFKRLWFWISILVLTFTSLIIYFSLFYSGVQVKDVIISGNYKVDTQDIENLVSQNINNKILSLGRWEINSKSIFLVNSDKLNKDLLNKFPIIESVEINRKFLQKTLDFKINEKVAVAVFCPSLNKQESCYFLDNKGMIFEPLSVISQNLFIVRQEMDNAQIFAGERAVRQNIIDLLLKLEKNLKDNFQIDLREALIASPLRLNVNTNENWEIYFDLNLDSDADSQITKLNLLLSNEIKPENRKNLRYINLIPKNKAVVCDNETCE